MFPVSLPGNLGSSFYCLGWVDWTGLDWDSSGTAGPKHPPLTAIMRQTSIIVLFLTVIGEKTVEARITRDNIICY